MFQSDMNKLDVGVAQEDKKKVSLNLGPVSTQATWMCPVRPIWIWPFKLNVHQWKQVHCVSIRWKVKVSPEPLGFIHQNITDITHIVTL